MVQATSTRFFLTIKYRFTDRCFYRITKSSARGKLRYYLVIVRILALQRTLYPLITTTLTNAQRLRNKITESTYKQLRKTNLLYTAVQRQITIYFRILSINNSRTSFKKTSRTLTPAISRRLVEYIGSTYTEPYTIEVFISPGIARRSRTLRPQLILLKKKTNISGLNLRLTNSWKSIRKIRLGYASYNFAYSFSQFNLSPSLLLSPNLPHN